MTATDMAYEAMQLVGLLREAKEPVHTPVADAYHDGIAAIQQTTEKAVKRMLSLGDAAGAQGYLFTQSELATVAAAIASGAEIARAVGVQESQREILSRTIDAELSELTTPLREGWVTIGSAAKKGEEEEHGGVHVFLGAGGHIEKGPSHMLGKKPSELKGSKVTAKHGDKHPETGDKEGPKEKPETPVDNPQSTRNNVGSGGTQPTGDAKVDDILSVNIRRRTGRRSASRRIRLADRKGETQIRAAGKNPADYRLPSMAAMCPQERGRVR